MSSRVRSSYEAVFAGPVGISVFEGRLYISDTARETVSSVDADLPSEEHLMQRNIPQLGVLKVYTNSFKGTHSGKFILTSIVG